MSYNKETGLWEGFIYKIYNDINNKIYVGQTIRTIEERWHEHELAANDTVKFTYSLYKAIRKYKIENFHIKEIEKISYYDREILSRMLDEKEIYWISFYDSYRSGYNETIGGKDAPNKFLEREIYEYNLDGIKLNKYNSLTQATEITGLNRSDICACCQKNNKINRVDNRIFRYVEDPLTEEEIKWYKMNYPKIYQYDYYGNLLNIFEFIQDAVDYMINNGIKCKHSNISACCYGQYLSAYGYVWRKYPDTFDTFKTPKINIIEQRNIINGELIHSYNTYDEIYKKYKFDISTISNCCNQHIATAYGYHWCYKGEFNIDNLRRTQCKMVDMYSIDGIHIKTFNSFEEGKKYFGIVSKSNMIGEVCAGNRMTAYGYVWRYFGEPFDKYKIDVNKIKTNNRIYQCDMNNNIICIHNTLKDAACSINTTNKKYIKECCMGERESYKGFKWFYEDTYYNLK